MLLERPPVYLLPDRLIIKGHLDEHFDLWGESQRAIPHPKWLAAQHLAKLRRAELDAQQHHDSVRMVTVTGGDTPTYRKPSLITKQEASMPEEADQPDRDERGLYKSAEDAREHLLDVLDRQRGVASRLGLPTTDDPASTGAKEHDNGVVVVPTLKSRSRAREKVRRKLGGKWHRLHDVARASIAVKRHDDIRRVMEELRKSGLSLVKRPTNRFDQPTEAGYRDLQTHWRTRNGHIAEIQLHTIDMLRAKEKQGHKYYEEARAIQAAAKAERRQMTSEERTKYESLISRMKNVYDAAWDEARKAFGSPSSIRFNRHRFYNWNGQPAYRESSGHFPRVLRDGKWTHDYDLWQFMHEAQPVSRFKFLLHARRQTKMTNLNANSSPA